MTAPNPMTHKCDLDTLDYRAVDQGTIRCWLAAGGCGARYELVPGVGWARTPRPVGRRHDRT